MDIHALAKGGKKGGKGKEKGNKSKKFDGNSFWCDASGHMMEDCQKKVAGKSKTAQSPRASEPKGEGKSKGKGKSKSKGKRSSAMYPENGHSRIGRSGIIKEEKDGSRGHRRGKDP